MRPQRSYRDYLRDILEAAEEALDFVQGMDILAFYAGWRINLGVLEILPIDSKLTDGGAHGSQLAIAPTLVWNHGVSLVSGIQPLSMATATSAGQFLATNRRQSASDIAIGQGTATTVSSHTGLLASAICALRGRGLPKSS